MKFNYQFSNLCGTVYNKGNVVFTPDGNSVLSPVGNRVSVFDLLNEKSYTMPFENRKNISVIALSPNGLLLITVDEEGYAMLVNFPRRVVLHHFNFKGHVASLKFSPNGRYIAVAIGKQVQVWKTPGLHKEFNAFALHKDYSLHDDEITCINWSPDSSFIISGSKDSTCKVYTVENLSGYRPFRLVGHRERIVDCYFAKDSLDIYSLSRDGALFHWTHSQYIKEFKTFKGKPVRRTASATEQQEANPDDDEMSDDEEPTIEHESADEQGTYQDTLAQGSTLQVKRETKPAKPVAPVRAPAVRFRWSLTMNNKHYFMQNQTKLICSSFHRETGILAAGFANGVFLLYELPDFNQIHSMNISQKRITTAAFNNTGEWIAFGCARLGQLLVWEWQSESCVLRQQGHFYDMNVLTYSPDGQFIVTGGDDGKVKLWNTTTGFCVTTFTEHTGGITALCFAQSGLAILSASLDGTVRAFDRVRYRNFKTFTSPQPTQFTTLALDPSGEIVCAGTQDSFEVYLWSMQSGHLLDVLAGHKGPVSGLAFNPRRPVLASCSWDQSIKIWSVYEKKTATESLELTSDCVALAYRPDGEQLAVSSLDGVISIWIPTLGQQIGSLYTRMDIGTGRLVTDEITSKQKSGGVCFTSLCYTADGMYLLAGGNSKYVCIYELNQQVLIKQFVISNNLSVDGTQRLLNSKFMTDAGPLALINDDSESDVDLRVDSSLPGVTKGDFSSRQTMPEIRTKAVQFSPTGRAWAAASTEGLLIYSLDERMLFDPFELDMEITPASVKATIARNEFTKAIVMSIRLNEKDIIHEAIEKVPFGDIELIAQSLPLVYLQKVLEFIASQLISSRHFEYYLSWCKHLLTIHGRYLKDNSNSFLPTFRALQKHITYQQTSLQSLCDDNKYSLSFIQSILARCPEEGIGSIEEII